MSESNIYKRRPKRPRLYSVVEEEQCCLVPGTPTKPPTVTPETQKVYSRKKLATQVKDCNLLSGIGSSFAIFSNEKNTEIDGIKQCASCVTMFSSDESNVLWNSSVGLTDEAKDEQSYDRTIRLGSIGVIDFHSGLDSLGMINLNPGEEKEQRFAPGLIDLNVSLEPSFDGTGTGRTSSVCEGLDLNKAIYSFENIDGPNKEVMQIDVDDGEPAFLVSNVVIEGFGDINRGDNDCKSMLSHDIPFIGGSSLLKSQSSTYTNPTSNDGKMSENATCDQKSRQKPRRKRYRPKIDIKPMTPKPATPKRVREKKPKQTKQKGKKPEKITKKRSFVWNEVTTEGTSLIALETKNTPVVKFLDFDSESLDVKPLHHLTPNKGKRSKRRRKLNLFSLTDGRVTKNSKKRVLAINWIGRKRRLHMKRPQKVKSNASPDEKSKEVTTERKILADEKSEEVKESKVLLENSEEVSKSNTLSDKKIIKSNALPEEKSEEIEIDKKLKKLFNYTLKKFSQLSIDEGKRKPKAKGRKGRPRKKLSDKGALVLYQGPFDPAKKNKKKKGQVDLDLDTLKVWNLLKDEDDKREEKAIEDEKWKKEREVFFGRVSSFIAQMHQIQGDRGFRKWNGSVLDSVVGVFLTQNVTDNYSSNCFLSLAAKFPSQRTCQNSAFGGYLGMAYDQELVGSTEYNAEGNEYFVKEPSSEINKEETLIHGIKETCYLQIEDITPMFKSLESSQDDLQIIDTNLPDESHHNPNDQTSNSKRIPGASLMSGANYCVPSELTQEVEAEVGKTSDVSHCSQDKFQSQNTSVGAPVIPSEKVVQGQNTKMQHDDVTSISKKKGKGKAPKEPMDWESLRKKYSTGQRSSDQMDSVNWEAVRVADLSEIANIIETRGQQNGLARNIQLFLNNLIVKHDCLDIEWLRNTPPDIAKACLLEARGLGPKSVECVQLLSLKHVAFPVDTNVARIVVRLGWVPLQPLPGDLHLHLLEEYPDFPKIQQYLWPRLCTLDHKTLYELHYQMITFGKVFCTKKKPNCNACPMRANCKHFASEWSARNALPAGSSGKMNANSAVSGDPIAPISSSGAIPLLGFEHQTKICEPIIEEPFEPQAKYEAKESEESEFEVDSEGIPIFRLNLQDFKTTLSNYMKDKFEDGDISKALVALTSEAASVPARKLKTPSRLRTEHLVYELPRNHIILQELQLDQTESDNDVQYHLAIWTPGETADSTQPAEENCNCTESELCDKKTCFKCNNIREQKANVVRGTLLIPCRVACRGSFPLNGTYFQHNEVFADHKTSLEPINVPREWLFNLRTRTAYFGVSSKMLSGLSQEQIKQCFWKGLFCIRGFDRTTRYPQPLVQRFHLQPNKKKVKGEASVKNVRKGKKKSGEASVKNAGNKAKKSEQMRPPTNLMLSQGCNGCMSSNASCNGCMSSNASIDNW